MRGLRSQSEAKSRSRMISRVQGSTQVTVAERAFVGEYTDTKTRGTYACRACGAELFTSDTKFDSHCGWPSFFDPAASDAVILRPDESLGMRRVEVLCASCHSHLGHVFTGEGYPTPTDQRYCINSICLTLVPAAE